MRPSAPIRLVLFDCDGTLVDSQHVIVARMSEAFAEFGLDVPARDKVLGIVGLSLEEAVGQLLDGQSPGGLNSPVVPALANAYREQYRRYRETGPAEPLYPGAAETVRALAARDDVLLGIVTGKSQRGVRGVLGHYGLLDHFVTIQTADDAPSKPHPAMVLQAIAATGAEATDTVVIGDTTFDMVMARSAGAGAIGVGWGYHAPATLPGAGAETVLDGFGDLLPWLDRRWAGQIPGGPAID